MIGLFKFNEDTADVLDRPFIRDWAALFRACSIMRLPALGLPGTAECADMACRGS